MVVRPGRGGLRRAGVRAVGVDDEAALARTVGDRHAQRVEQRVVFLGRAAGRREVVADDQRVGAGEQAHGLELAEHALATAGEPQPRVGRISRNSAIAWSASRGVSARWSPSGVPARESSRLIGTSHGLELGELEREVDALLERLAHAEDPAAAQLHAGVDARGCAVATRSS